MTPELKAKMQRIEQMLNDLKHMPEMYAHEIKQIEKVAERYKSAGLFLIEGGKIDE